MPKTVTNLEIHREMGISHCAEHVQLGLISNRISQPHLHQLVFRPSCASVVINLCTTALMGGEIGDEHFGLCSM